MRARTAEEVIQLLGLEPLPGEGGFYAETYRSPHPLPGAALPDGYGGARSLATAIYYLLTPASFSSLHRLPGDEVYHFYLGDAVEMLRLHGDGRGEVIRLGADLAAGERPQVVVPGGVWQGARLVEGGRWALLGTTMAPGFEFEDFTPADAAALAREHPEHAYLIEALAP